MKQRETQVPSAALRWSAPCEFGAGKPDAGEKIARYPIRIMARSGKVLQHCYWGRIVHDMAGLRIHKPELPVDYCHDYNQVLGYLDQFETASGDLETAGELISTSPDDRVAEIAAKAAAGVPYEASIMYDPNTMLIEELPQGQSAEVNGYRVEGPAVIVREWNLRGVAVCPYGQDMHTKTAFSEGQLDQVKIHTVTVEAEMSKDSTPPAAGEQAANPPAPTKPDAAAPLAAGQQTAVTDQAGAEAGKPMVEKLQQAAAPTGQDFLDKFGTQGGVWFAQGKTFAEATELHTQQIEAENVQLKAKLAAVDRGEADPLSFAAGESAGEDQADAGKFGGDENRAKFCAGIKVPKK